MTGTAPQPPRGGLSATSKGLLGITFLLLLAAVAIVFLQAGPTRLAADPAGVFDLQGHRGARGLYPENSLPAFAAALAIGVTTLEMDLGMTRDGILVVHHDPHLDPARTRGPDGAFLKAPAPALKDLSLAEIKTFDLGRAAPGGKVAQRFPDQLGLDGVAMPSLAEVVALAEARSGGRIRYNIETKISPLAANDTAAPAAFVEALAEIIEETGIAGRTAVQSFDWRSLSLMKARLPEVTRVYLTAERTWLDNLQRGEPGVSPWTDGLDLDAETLSVPQAIDSVGGSVWSPYYRDLRDADLAEAQRLGLKVVVWTVNEPADMAALIELGVDGIITDYPDRLRKVMAEKGLALPPAYGE